MTKIAKATCLLGVLGAVFGGGVLTLVACVDGTTPDCTIPDSGCDPSAVEDASGNTDGDANGDVTTTGDGAADGATDAPTEASPGDDAGDDAADGATE